MGFGLPSFGPSFGQITTPNTIINGDFVLVNHRNMNPHQDQFFKQYNDFAQKTNDMHLRAQAMMTSLFQQMSQQQLEQNELKLAIMRNALEKTGVNMRELENVMFQRVLPDNKNATDTLKKANDALYELITEKFPEEKETVDALINAKDDDNGFIEERHIQTDIRSNDTMGGTEKQPYQSYFEHPDILSGIEHAIRLQSGEEGIAMRDRNRAFMPDTARRGDSNLIIAHVNDDFYWRQRIIFATSENNLNIAHRPCLVLFYSGKTFKIVNNLLVLPIYANENGVETYAAEVAATNAILKYLHYNLGEDCKTLNVFSESVTPSLKMSISSNELTILDSFDTMAFPSIYQNDYRVMTRMTINEYRKRLKSYTIR